MPQCRLLVNSETRDLSEDRFRRARTFSLERRRRRLVLIQPLKSREEGLGSASPRPLRPRAQPRWELQRASGENGPAERGRSEALGTGR